jgi:nicotinamide mononucleotide transporter
MSGFLLDSYTDAALPFLDALVTWGAVIATYMVAKKLLENWVYWFIIDGISVFLFIARDLWLTALLFAIYMVIIFFGYQSWNKIRNESNAISS